MIDFAEKARVSKEADQTLKSILAKGDDSFAKYEEVNKISDIEVAKMIIKRLVTGIAQEDK